MINLKHNPTLEYDLDHTIKISNISLTSLEHFRIKKCLLITGQL